MNFFQIIPLFKSLLNALFKDEQHDDYALIGRCL